MTPTKQELSQEEVAKLIGTTRSNVQRIEARALRKIREAFQREASAKRYGQFFPAGFLILDTLQLAMWYCRITGEKPANMKLGTLAKHFGFECGESHDALADVKLAHCVAIHIEQSIAQLRAAA